MANGVHKITEDFEKALSEYTNAPYVVTVDNQSNGLFLSLYYENNIKKIQEEHLKNVKKLSAKSVANTVGYVIQLFQQQILIRELVISTL